MEKELRYDYFYGNESEQFSFFRIPRHLVTGMEFKQLSTDAKLLYGLLLDRMGLSSRNGWYDEKGRVYIFYPLEEIEFSLNCSHSKAVRLFAELDKENGIGLIERTRQGLGKPSRIYVKRFTTREILPHREPEIPDGFPEVSKQDFQKFQNDTSGSFKTTLPKVSKRDAIYTEKNQTEKTYPDPSIRYEMDLIDRDACRKEVKEAISFSQLVEDYGEEDIEGVTELITDILCSTRRSFQIGGETIPAEPVKRRFYSLEKCHIEYVLDCLKKTTTKIHNIKGYLLTSLYNAPLTIGAYYQAEVQHDLYG